MNSQPLDPNKFDTTLTVEAEPPTQVDKPGRNLYFGDNGELEHEARRVFVHLLSNGTIDHGRHPNLWNGLLRHEAPIKVRLSDLFLELMIDYESKVAFPRQADTGELDAPKLLREHQLRLYDSLLMLFLRQVLSHAEAQGIRPTVSLDEILDHMVVYDQSGNRNNVDLRSRVTASINRAHTKLAVLYKVPGINDRYEISRALKLMISVNEINVLRDIYDAIGKGELAAQLETAPSEEE